MALILYLLTQTNKKRLKPKLSMYGRGHCPKFSILVGFRKEDDLKKEDNLNSGEVLKYVDNFKMNMTHQC